MGIVCLNPSAAWWLLAAVPITALYWFRVRAPQCRVTTGFLWRQILPEGGFRMRWQRWRTSFSLAVLLTILVVMVAGLADFQADPPQPPAADAETQAIRAAIGDDRNDPGPAVPPAALAALGLAGLLLTAEWCAYQRRWLS